MAGSTMTRAQLSEAVYQEVGLSRNESAELVENVLDEISDTLVREMRDPSGGQRDGGGYEELEYLRIKSCRNVKGIGLIKS